MQLRDRLDVIQRLQERIDGMQHSRLSVSDRCGISTGFSDLDRLLADGGLRRGTLIEWLSDGPGSGAATLALSVAAHILREEGAFVVIDEASDFYPVAAADLGIPLERTVIVRSGRECGTTLRVVNHDAERRATMTALWAWEQSLRCPGVAVTFGRIGHLDGRQFRRLQLAVEAGEGLGFLIRARLRARRLVGGDVHSRLSSSSLSASEREVRGERSSVKPLPPAPSPKRRGGVFLRPPPACQRHPRTQRDPRDRDRVGVAP